MGAQRTDAELVRATMGGDRAAFGEIYDRYGERLHSFCSRVLNDPHEAADATQDTFVLAVKRMEQLRDPDRLRPWLYAIARNECTRRGRLRSRHVLTAEVDDMVVPDAPDFTAGIGASEASALLWAAAEGLDERDRLLLELSVRQGLDGADLADAAGIRPGQISMAVGRMRERVERSLGALLIARQGNPDCPELATVLAGWDGAFTVLLRKRVARHVEGCLDCEEKRQRLVAPLASLGAVGFLPVPLPFDLRERVMGAVDHLFGADTPGATGAGGVDETTDPASSASAAATETWLPSGFPPLLPFDEDEDLVAAAPTPPPDPRRKPLLALAGVAVIVVLLAAFLLLNGDDDADTDLLAAGAVTTSTVAVAPGQGGNDPFAPPTAAVGGGSTTTEAGQLPGPATTVAAATTTPGLGTPEDADGAPDTDGPDVGTPPASPPPDGAVVTSPPVTRAPGTTAPPTTSVPRPTTTRPAVTTTRPTVPPPPPSTTTAPNRAPVISGAGLSTPGPLRTISCTPPPKTATASAAVVDDRGIASVDLLWSQAGGSSGSKPMTFAGGVWSATLGPFPFGGTVTWQVRAIDTNGEGSTASGSIAVDPCPG